MKSPFSKIHSEYELDDPRRTMEHRDIILSKGLLKAIYMDWYSEMLGEAATCPAGIKLELGSGGGFLKDLDNSIVTSDIMELPVVDKVITAESIPYESGELSAILMVNVFHHIPEVRKFIAEARRVLKKGGKIIMVEPARTIWSKLIYKHLHHELYDEKRDWTFPATGPLSGSNQALPWIVFKRDRDLFSREFPDFEIRKMRKHTGFRYLFSGGVSQPQLLPSFTNGLIKLAEGITSPLTAMFYTIVIVRR